MGLPGLDVSNSLIIFYRKLNQLYASSYPGVGRRCRDVWMPLLMLNTYENDEKWLNIRYAGTVRGYLTYRVPANGKSQISVP